MFKVQHIITGKIIKVYKVTETNDSEIWFLTFCDTHNEWTWEKAHNYEPYEG